MFNKEKKEEKDDGQIRNKYQQETGCEMIRWSLFNSTKVKKILVTYTDLENKKNEIVVSKDALGDKYISVYFLYNDNFEIHYPQQIILKFVTDEALYIIETELKDIIREKNLIYFTIKSPPQIERRQKRMYYRINLTKNVVIMANDPSKECGVATVFAKIINLSAGGVKIGNIEPFFPNEKEDVKLSMYENFRMILILNSKTLVRLRAKMVRFERSKSGEPFYCFSFEKQLSKDIDTISKFIIVEQVNQKKLEKESKDQFRKAMMNKFGR